MCGICGSFNLDSGAADPRTAAAMSERLAHRGPDDSGLWSQGPVAFGFRRLSILDLEGGHQPMLSADGKLALVFNGEIYNHPELKGELEAQGAKYRTRSDTETILHLYERAGIGAFAKLNGMFAIALWDARRRELVLGRDPLGVKPLYYSLKGETLLFASELRALLAGGVSDELDPASVLEYLRFGRVHAPKTALASALKLPPGHLLRVNARGVQVEKFWEIPARPAHRRWKLEEAEHRLEELLRDSVRGQLLSDVPVGAFLSGGLDSALVAAFMAAEAGRKISTFTIGFSGAARDLDESPFAREASRALGTEHHELILPSDVLDRLEELGPCLDEPIADSAILPTYLLAQFARRQVKVVLTGEGADELFAGYGRYKAAYLSERLGRWPGALRALAAPVARRMGKGPLFAGLPMSSIKDWAQALTESPAESIDGLLQNEFLDSVGRPDPLGWLTGDDEPHTLNQTLAFDLRTVLCDSLLMKVDKATMRASLEARVPYLDKRLVEFAVGLPPQLKLRRWKGKFILRRLARKFLPRPLVWRRKHGFLVPWEAWVRRRDNRAIDGLLSGSELTRRGIFQRERLEELRRRLVENEPGGDPGLFFRVVVFGLWLESLKEYRPASSTLR